MDKKLNKKLKLLFEVIIQEAEKNKEFAEAMGEIFCNDILDKDSSVEKRASNRRDKAVLDPIKLAEEGELKEDILLPLTVKELKDIVADFGMDQSKLAMKWKDKDRLIQLILDTSFRRASKGEAFRK